MWRLAVNCRQVGGPAAALSEAVTESMQPSPWAAARSASRWCRSMRARPADLERVEFQVSTNASQPLRALAKVASGGELSRIGLAIQVIASRSLDDADADLRRGRCRHWRTGGEIVGQMLRRLGDERQVLCVTHLPQVAAQARWQWNIARRSRAVTP